MLLTTAPARTAITYVVTFMLRFSEIAFKKPPRYPVNCYKFKSTPPFFILPQNGLLSISKDLSISKKRFVSNVIPILKSKRSHFFNDRVKIMTIVH